MITPDSYMRLAKAVNHYVYNNGAVHIDVPWIVKKEISAITKPTDSIDYPFGGNVLVASSEQSFLSIYDTLDDSNIYVALTPCFRDEHTLDKFHQNYFYKVELFTKDVSLLKYVIAMAWAFMQDELGWLNPVIEVEQTDGSIDLMYNDVELGSYGIRTHDNMTWVFGTGLAEPRFTVALETINESSLVNS